MNEEELPSMSELFSLNSATKCERERDNEKRKE